MVGSGVRWQRLRQLVLDAANEIHDPCGLAYGHAIGLADMGLIRALDVQESVGGWRVDVTLRLTAPTCLYYFYFERELRFRLEGIDGVVGVEIRWDQVYDWTPDALAPSARARLEEARARTLARLEANRAEASALARQAPEHASISGQGHTVKGRDGT